MQKPIMGFTLVELMTVILVLGILVGVGVPTYRDYVMRAKRAEAKTTLMRVQAQQEKFYMQNNTYTTDVNNPPPVGLGIPASENLYYSIAIVADAAGLTLGYAASATPAAGSPQLHDDDCALFRVDQNGVRYAESKMAVDTSQTCWKR